MSTEHSRLVSFLVVEPAYLVSLMQDFFWAAFGIWAPRRVAWLPVSIIRGRAARPATASVNDD
jgi:hypothetical protein